jgi:hypothetical protein
MCVRQVLIRAVTDPEFREAFFADCVRAVEDYDLTEEERSCLAEIHEDDRLAEVYQQAEAEADFSYNDSRI